MAFSVVDHSNNTENDVTSGSVPMPTGTQVGDRILVFVSQSNDETISWTGSATVTKVDDTNLAHEERGTLFISDPLSVVETQTFGWALQNFYRAAITTIRGGGAITPGDFSNTPVNTDSTDITATLTVPSAPSEVLAWFNTSASRSFSAPTGMTEIESTGEGFSRPISICQLDDPASAEPLVLTATLNTLYNSDNRRAIAIAVGPEVTTSTRTITPVAANLSESFTRTVSTVAANLQVPHTRTVGASANLQAVEARTVSSVAANVSQGSTRTVTAAANLSQAGIERTVGSVFANLTQRGVGPAPRAGIAKVSGR